MFFAKCIPRLARESNVVPHTSHLRRLRDSARIARDGGNFKREAILDPQLQRRAPVRLVLGQ